MVCDSTKFKNRLNYSLSMREGKGLKGTASGDGNVLWGSYRGVCIVRTQTGYVRSIYLFY